MSNAASRDAPPWNCVANHGDGTLDSTRAGARRLGVAYRWRQMSRARRALPWGAALSLLLQVAVGGVSLSAMALAAGPAATVVCTCFRGAGEHGECPMHHTASGKARCRVRGMDDSATAALAALLAPLVTPPSASADLAALPARPCTQAALALPVTLAFAPDLRPPRS